MALLTRSQNRQNHDPFHRQDAGKVHHPDGICIDAGALRPVYGDNKQISQV